MLSSVTPLKHATWINWTLENKRFSCEIVLLNIMPPSMWMFLYSANKTTLWTHHTKKHLSTLLSHLESSIFSLYLPSTPNWLLSPCCITNVYSFCLFINSRDCNNKWRHLLHLKFKSEGFWSHFGVDSMNQEDDLELRFPFHQKDKE